MTNRTREFLGRLLNGEVLAQIDDSRPVASRPYGHRFMTYREDSTAQGKTVDRRAVTEALNAGWLVLVREEPRKRWSISKAGRAAFAPAQQDTTSQAVTP